MSTANRFRLRSSAPIVLAALASLSIAGCRPEQAAAPEPVRPVKVVTAAPKATTRQVSYSGTVKARREANLGFRVSGKIVERRVDVGEHVEPGAILARIDRVDLELALRSAEATVTAAQSQLAVAQNAYDRSAALFARGFATQATLDDRKLALDQAHASLDQARSGRDQAANQAAYAELKSDVAGVVTSIQAEAGLVVAMGAPVVVVARDGEKEVAVAIPESEIRFFKVGDRLAVHFWADPDLAASGVVREIAGSADATSRTFALRVSLPDDPALRLGETATLVADLPAGDGGIEIPLAALTERDGHPNVWVVDPATRTVAPRRVATAAFADDGVRIADGLRPGDLVVTAGAQFMTPGKRVTLARDEAAGAGATALASAR